MSYNSIYRRDLFRDQIVVLTGGGSGIGRCTAHELASLGACVAIVGRNEAKLERVRGEVESDGGSKTARLNTSTPPADGSRVQPRPSWVSSVPTFQ